MINVRTPCNVIQYTFELGNEITVFEIYLKQLRMSVFEKAGDYISAGKDIKFSA